MLGPLVRRAPGWRSMCRWSKGKADGLDCPLAHDAGSNLTWCPSLATTLHWFWTCLLPRTLCSSANPGPPRLHQRRRSSSPYPPSLQAPSQENTRWLGALYCDDNVCISESTVLICWSLNRFHDIHCSPIPYSFSLQNKFRIFSHSCYWIVYNV